MDKARSAILHHKFVGEGHFDMGLRIGELMALQELLGVGPQLVAQRLLTQAWLVQDLRHVIRLGLIGGGMRQDEALAVVERNVVEGHLADYAALAAEVLLAALHGVEDEPLEGEA